MWNHLQGYSLLAKGNLPAAYQTFHQNNPLSKQNMGVIRIGFWLQTSNPSCWDALVALRKEQAVGCSLNPSTMWSWLHLKLVCSSLSGQLATEVRKARLESKWTCPGEEVSGLGDTRFDCLVLAGTTYQGVLFFFPSKTYFLIFRESNPSSPSFLDLCG